MAKKVRDKYGNVVKVDCRGVPKKNRHALKCCLSFLAVFFLIIGLGLTATFFVGDYLLKNKLGSEYGIEEYFNKYLSFKNYKEFEKKQLNNTYKDKDAKDFIDSLERSLFLENLSTQQVQTIVDSLIDSLLKKEDNSSAEQVSKYISDLQPLSPEDIITQLLENNLSRTKIENYQDGTANEYFVDISDKGLAAFLNNIVLNSLLNSPYIRQNIEKEIKSLVDEFDIDFSLDQIDFKDFLQIKQISFYSASPQEQDVGIKIITKTNIKKLADSILNQFSGNNLLRAKASGLAKFGADSLVFIAKNAINMLLPAKLYICIDMPILQEKPPSISLNNFTQDLDELSKKVPEVKELTKMFKSGGSVYRAIQNINEVVPISQSLEVTDNSGKITVDMVGTFLELAKVNYDKNGVKKPQEEQSTSNDVYLMLKGFVGADTDAALQQKQQYDYTRFEFVKEDGNFVFDENGIPKMMVSQPPLREIEIIQSEYEQALLASFSQSYGLTQGITFDEFFDLIIGEGSENDFVSLFDSEKIKEIAKGQSKGAVITPKMLSAILAKYSQRFLGENQLDITLRYLTMFDEVVGGKNHNLVEIGVEIGLKSLLKNDDDGFLSKITAALVPDFILIGVKMDITPNLPQSEYISPNLFIDRLSYDETQKITRLIQNFGLFDSDDEQNQNSLDSILQESLLPIRDIINQMDATLPGFSLGESGIVAPDVYHALAGILNKNAKEEILPSEIADSLKFLFSEIDFEERIKNLDGLISELNYYYALKLNSNSPTPLKELFDSLNITGGETEISDIVDIDELKTLLFSDKTASQLSPALSGDMFASLIYEYISTANDTEDIARFLPDGSIADIKFFIVSDRNMVSFTVILDLEVLLSYGEQSEIMDFLSSLIGEIAVTVELDISPQSEGQIPTKIILNSSTEDAAQKTENLFVFLDKLMGDFSTQMLDNIASTLDGSVREIFMSMHQMGLSVRIQDNKLLLSDLFSVLDSTLGAENKIGADNLKKVLEEIYINPADIQNNLWLEKDNAVPTSKEQEINNVINQLDFNDFTQGVEVEIKDSTIAGMLSHEAAGKFDGAVSAVFILAQGDNTPEADSLRDWLSGYDGLDYTQKDYMIVKVKIDIAKLGQIDVSSANKLLPEKMYVSLLFELSGNKPTYKWFRINNMSKTEQQNLLKFIGKSSEIEDILGGSGPDNIGGKFFEQLATDVLGFIDHALHSEFDGMAASLGLTFNIEYSYKALASGTGKMIISLSVS